MLTRHLLMLTTLALVSAASTIGHAENTSESSNYPLYNAYNSCARGSQFEGYNCAQLNGRNARAQAPAQVRPNAATPSAPAETYYPRVDIQ